MFGVAGMYRERPRADASARASSMPAGTRAFALAMALGLVLRRHLRCGCRTAQTPAHHGGAAVGRCATRARLLRHPGPRDGQRP